MWVQYLKRPAEGVESSTARVTGSCRNQIQSSGKAALNLGALNHQASSQASCPSNLEFWYFSHARNTNMIVIETGVDSKHTTLLKGSKWWFILEPSMSDHGSGAQTWVIPILYSSMVTMSWNFSSKRTKEIHRSRLRHFSNTLARTSGRRLGKAWKSLPQVSRAVWWAFGLVEARGLSIYSKGFA